MKTKLQLFILCILLAFSAKQANAQTLIQFWDFNNVRPLTGAGGDSLGTMVSYDSINSHYGWDTLHATYPLYPAYSKVAGGKIVYIRPMYHYASIHDSILDSKGPGGSYIYDYSSSHYTYFTSSDSSFAEGNGFIRTRNPSDSAAIYVYAPTTGYNNITFQFAITASSSSGAMYNVFSYSTNGGTTWKNLTGVMDTFTVGGHHYPDTLLATNSITDVSGWFPVNINLTSDASVNNNANFIFRIMMAGATSRGTSGNDRYDNFAFWSNPPASVDEVSTQASGYNVYPNPANDMISVVGTYEGSKIITVCNILGQQLNTTTSAAKQTSMNIADLSSGVYFINIKEVETGANFTTKFIKN